MKNKISICIIYLMFCTISFSQNKNVIFIIDTIQSDFGFNSFSVDYATTFFADIPKMENSPGIVKYISKDKRRFEGMIQLNKQSILRVSIDNNSGYIELDNLFKFNLGDTLRIESMKIYKSNLNDTINKTINYYKYSAPNTIFKTKNYLKVNCKKSVNVIIPETILLKINSIVYKFNVTQTNQITITNLFSGRKKIRKIKFHGRELKKITLNIVKIENRGNTDNVPNGTFDKK